MGMSRPLHVGLIYWDPFTPGGIQSQVAGRLDHLGYPGGPVRYTLFTKQPPPAANPWPHIRTELFSGWDRFSIAVSEYTASINLAKQLSRVHKEDPFDLLDVHGPGVWRWAKLNSVPYLAVCHSLRFFTQQHHGHRREVALYYSWSMKRQFRDASRVVAVGSELKNELIRFGVPSCRIVTLPAAISVPPVPEGELEGAPSEPLRLLFVGRASPEKGFDILLQALQFVNECGREVELTVIGHFTSSHRQINNGSFNNIKVRFIGCLSNNDVFGLMKESDVLVVPSRYESCGLVAREGLAAGMIVIASRVGGLTEAIRHRENGLLFDPSCPGELASLIKEIMDDRLKFQILRLKARQSAESFTWQALASKIYNLYATCV